MYPLLGNRYDELITASSDCDPFTGSSFINEYFGPNARSMFSFIFEHYNLKREDEIAILTTSNATYVSTCVSVQCFNYSKISRVVTEKTRMIILIHEYGYILDDLEALIDRWKEKGITVIEDCAHVCGLKMNNKTIGSYGDFSLYSFTKTLPGKSGGLLRTNEQIKKISFSLNDNDRIEAGINCAKKYLQKQDWFNSERDNIANLYRASGISIYEPTKICCPFFIGVEVNDKQKVMETLEGIEFGGTLRSDLIYIPTNPLVEKSVHTDIIQILKELNCDKGS